MRRRASGSRSSTWCQLCQGEAGPWTEAHSFLFSSRKRPNREADWAAQLHARARLDANISSIIRHILLLFSAFILRADATLPFSFPQPTLPPGRLAFFFLFFFFFPCPRTVGQFLFFSQVPSCGCLFGWLAGFLPLLCSRLVSFVKPFPVCKVGQASKHARTHARMLDAFVGHARMHAAARKERYWMELNASSATTTSNAALLPRAPSNVVMVEITSGTGSTRLDRPGERGKCRSAPTMARHLGRSSHPFTRELYAAMWIDDGSVGMWVAAQCSAESRACARRRLDEPHPV
ncbi:hypothetical protein IWX49DRAFT_331396 [Phyllosticta citricarpa]